MESPLNFKHFSDFEDLFNEFSKDINKMEARKILTSEDIVQIF